MTRVLRLGLVVAVASAALAVSAAAEQKSAGEAGVVRCANLIYANNKSSVCFSDRFLTDIEKQTNVKTSGKFTSVKLESGELYDFPFAVMTGEGGFTLTAAQRENLRNYLTRGGFLVASAGCSNDAWTKSFTDEIKAIFPDLPLKPIEMSHPIFQTVYHIRQLVAKRTGTHPRLFGLEFDGKIVLIWSPDGLNDTANAGGNCCCCGGNEIRNSREVNVNLLAYALTH
jgi:Domain of unknown function (DUF4159)